MRPNRQRGNILFQAAPRVNNRVARRIAEATPKWMPRIACRHRAEISSNRRNARIAILNAAYHEPVAMRP